MEKTLRDEIAIAAMQGLLSSAVCAGKREFATQAYQVADAMIEAREPEKSTGPLIQDMHKSDLARACEMSREYAQTLKNRIDNQVEWIERCEHHVKTLVEKIKAERNETTTALRACEESRQYVQTLEDRLEDMDRHYRNNSRAAEASRFYAHQLEVIRGEVERQRDMWRQSSNQLSQKVEEMKALLAQVLSNKMTTDAIGDDAVYTASYELLARISEALK